MGKVVIHILDKERVNMRRHQPIWMYILFGLAVVGLVSTFLTDFNSLIRNTIITAITIGIIYAIVHTFFLKRHNSNEIKKYRKAVKQSKKKYAQKPTGSYTQAKKRPVSKLKKRHKKTSHLRVIDGNKDTHKKMTL